MRFRLVTVAILLATASRGYGRPRDPDPLDSSQEGQQLRGAVALASSSSSSGSRSDSRLERPRELKDIQTMDQSLRTVATQLLNDTAKREDMVRIPEEKIVTIETPMQVIHISTRVEDAASGNNQNEEDNSSHMKFGIPVNSKFGHFEMSNPGHAMALTEEEIEREMATATTPAPKQQQPTTASMLSTWIQLYPPATTTEGNNAPDSKIDVQSNQIHSTTSTKLPSTNFKQTSANTKPNRKTEPKTSTTPIEKTTTEPSILTTKIIKNASTAGSSTNFVKVSTTLSPVSIENDVEVTESIEKNPQNQRTSSPPATPATTKSPVKRPPTKNNTTTKPKVTTPKNAANKPQKGNNNSNRLKPFTTRRPSFNKNETVTSTSKIEKVTLKPSTSSTPSRTESTDKPLFITKLKTSVITDAQKMTTTSPTMKPIQTLLSKTNFSNTESANAKVPTPTHVNNVLKVHVKKPTDDTTKIEIQPIRVNPPVLTIEKIGETISEKKAEIDHPPIMQNSKIDVKFDFDPNVEVISSSSELISPSTTTKKPRPTNKRKKNKNRRRRPTSTTTTTVASISSLDEALTSTDVSNLDFTLTGIQESKIEPESKAPPSKKKKQNQNSQIQKPIGTQIYNFLSREVMPSVGVMSLVGLGLGLASYFLYPFGGVIARRNYEVEPNYKYNLDEYGGNYGQSEEEVLSKVYSGMTGGQHHETKYNPTVNGEKNTNYYRYTEIDQPHQKHKPQPVTRYPTLAAKNQGNRVIYRPIETTSYEHIYRNNDVAFKYTETPTTSNYYERQRQPTDFVPTMGKVGIGNNRQFVVGNIPKEYSSGETEKTSDTVPMQDKVDKNVQYQPDQNSYDKENLPSSPMTSSTLEPLGNPAALISKVGEDRPADVYEEVEISPTALAVEHGPRSLRSLKDESEVKSMTAHRNKRSILPGITGTFIPLPIPRFRSSRSERSSVIQVIPSKSEIEKERKQEEQKEDLSNEILDIIDEALPGKEHQKKRHDMKVQMMNKQHIKGADSTKYPFKDMTSTSSFTTTKAASSSSSTAPISITTTTQKNGKEAPSTTKITTTTTSATTITTTTDQAQTEPDFIDQGETTLDWRDEIKTTAKPKPQSNGIDIIGIAKRIAEVKLRLGLTLLKHASEGFARYIGHIQKRFNGEQ